MVNSFPKIRSKTLEEVRNVVQRLITVEGASCNAWSSDFEHVFALNKIKTDRIGYSLVPDVDQAALAEGFPSKLMGGTRIDDSVYGP